MYKVVKEGARAREYEDALQWLVDARLEHKQSNPPYEVDFLIQRENDIFPVEVKSEANTSSKSLRKFKELYPMAKQFRATLVPDTYKIFNLSTFFIS